MEKGQQPLDEWPATAAPQEVSDVPAEDSSEGGESDDPDDVEVVCRTT